MKNEYTDEQINEAIMLANQTGKVYVWETEMYRNVIKHLPESQDEWERCTFDQVCIGDRIKVVDNHKSGDQTTYEGDVVKVSKTIIKTLDHALHSVYHSKWYRIPAPIVHPDPAVHEFILDKETGRRWEANGDIYVPILGRLGGADPRAFIDWTELELTAKEVNTDE